MNFKLLGINGSPKKPSEKSNSYFLLKTTLDAAKNAGAQTTLANLTQYELLQCTGCEICTTKSCPLDDKDDYKKLENLILEHDGIIIASPSYWSAPPGILKNFMDRSRDNKMPKQLWADKVFGGIAVAGLRVGGQESVVESLIRFALSHGMIVVGSTGHPWFNSPFPTGTMMYDIEIDGVQKTKFRSVKNDPISLKDAELLGKRIVSIGTKIIADN